jgi:hypothetical protein
MPIISAMWEAEVKRIPVPDQPEQKGRPYLKNNYSKKGGKGIVQVVEHQSSKHETLKSNSSTAPPKKKGGREDCVLGLGLWFLAQGYTGTRSIFCSNIWSLTPVPDIRIPNLLESPG